MLTTSQRRQFCQNHPRSPHRNGNDDDDDEDDDGDDLGDNDDDYILFDYLKLRR